MNFYKKKTSLASFQLLEEILTGLNTKDIVAYVFIDLSKSFDNVHPKILLQKLAGMGFKRVPMELISSCLTNCRLVRM